MGSSRRRTHALGKVWSFVNNKAQAGAPRTILGLFPTTKKEQTNGGSSNAERSNRPKHR